MATVVLVFAGLGLGFTVPIARALVTVFRGGAADWDPRREKLVCVEDGSCWWNADADLYR